MKHLYILNLFLCALSMTSYGQFTTTSHALVVENTGTGNVNWWNLTDGQEIDSNYITTEPCPNETTFTLLFREFDLNLPADAVINGMEFKLVRASTFDNEVSDQFVSVYDSTWQGMNKATQDYWTSNFQETSFGGSSDTWGVNFTPSYLNSGDFGIGIRLNMSESVCQNAFIDRALLTIYYESQTGNTCNLSDLVAEFDECTSDSTYRITVDFEHENTGGIGFDVWSNGTFIGFYNYGDLPLTFDHFPITVDSLTSLLICDNDDLNCCIDTSWLTPSCQVSECALDDMTVAVNCMNSTYTLEVDFNYQNTNDSFLLRGNGADYGTFAYGNLPVTIGPFPIGTSMDELLAIDAENPACLTGVALDIDCTSQNDCDIDIFDVTHSCTDSTFTLYIMLDTFGTSDSVIFTGNGNQYGTYAYDSVIVIGPLPLAGTYNELIVTDQLYPNCTDESDLEIDCIEPECAIENIEILSAENYDGNNFDLMFNFEYDGVSDSFEVYSGNTLVGIYPYSSLPLTIMDFPSRNLPDELLRICDHNTMSMECCDEIEFMVGNDCLPCKISEAEVTFIECDSMNAWATINFAIENGSGQFEIIGNGQQYGSFNYTDLPVTIMWEYVEGQHVDFIIRDLDEMTCLGYTYLEPFTCNEIECTISDLEVYDIECINDSAYTALLTFDYDGNTSDNFDLTVDGDFYGSYEYSELPIAVTINPSQPQVTHFVVCDNDNTSCCEDLNVPIPPCITAINETEAERLIRILPSLAGWTIEVPQEGVISIYNMAGQRVLNPTAIYDSIDVTNLMRGVYIVEYTNTDGRWSRKAIYF